MRVSTLANNLHVRQQVAQLNQELSKMQSQVASGKNYDGFKDLRSDSLRVLTLRSELQTIQGYTKSIAIADTRMSIMQDAFGRMHELGETSKINAIQAVYENEPRLDTIQPMAQTQLLELVNLANERVDGRNLFSGAQTDAAPVVDVETMLNGNELLGIKGLNGLIADRRLADGVDDATTPGRLAIGTNVGPGATATLTDSDITDNFGFTIKTVVSDTLTVTETGTGTQRVVEFGGFTAVNEGATITVELDLPDGTTVQVDLKATYDGTNEQSGVFLIGSNEDQTMANFASELTSELEHMAQTELAAASIQAAADMFFDNDPPLKITDPGGTPILEADDPDDPTLVRWYRGDTSDTGRAAVQAKVDDGTFISYGVRANEDPIKDTIRSMAVFAATEYTGTSEIEEEMYNAFVERVSDDMAVSGNALIELQGEMGIQQELIESIKARQQSVATLANNHINSLENVDYYALSANFSQYQMQLEASYAITARVQGLSLVNFIR